MWFSTTPSTKAVRLAFYSNGACTPEDEFYDFYKGELAHAPVTEYVESFDTLASLSAVRGPGRSAPVWTASNVSIASSSKGEKDLGNIGLGETVTLELDGMPAADATVTVSMDVLLVGGGTWYHASGVHDTDAKLPARLATLRAYVQLSIHERDDEGEDKHRADGRRVNQRFGVSTTSSFRLTSTTTR